MEIQKKEMQLLMETVEKNIQEAARELSLLELAYVGGGIGDTIGH